MREAVAVSAVVPVTERFDEVIPLFEAYKGAMEATGLPYEFVYVLDGEYPRILSDLRTLRERGERIRIISLAKWFGEATALSIGFAHAAGEIILTLPAYAQIRPALVLAVLMIVLGFQMIAVGLIGELIIFTHARDIKVTPSTRSSAERRKWPDWR